MLTKVEVTPTTISKENNIETLATAISMVNYEIMINGIAIPTPRSETITAEILRSSSSHRVQLKTDRGRQLLFM